MDNNFMLTGKTARQLYEKFAKNAPIYDYHCHLTAKEIYEDNEFSDISSLWIGQDHYKWRAMRYAGVPEKFITGSGTGPEKFKMWAKTCERLAGSPLYHWTDMELSTYFNISESLGEENAEKIYKLCNDKIKSEKLSPVKMIKKSNVKFICTTDDPVDSLEYHKKLGENKDMSFRVLPAFRPDRALNILDEGYKDYIGKLSESSGLSIATLQDLQDALKNRIEYFYQAGCLLSDHSLESLVYVSAKQADIETIFKKRINGEKITLEEAEKYRCHMLKHLAGEYSRKGWVMQLHIGALRRINDIMQRELGADTGFDIMNDFSVAAPLAKLLNDINNNGGVPKTVLYTLNHKDNLVLSALPPCFTEDGIPGKIQFGAAWWFNDHKEGIYEHLKTIAGQGMLAYFVGMLTDSRSFLSYVRHDYFRRILCSFVGELVESGEYRNDEKILKEIIEGICYKNIVNYLGLNS